MNVVVKSLIFTALVAGICIGANRGVITQISFHGTGNPNHPDIVQLQIEGGFDGDSGTSTLVAGIKKTDRHLIAAAISAWQNRQKIYVALDYSDLYFDNRATIVTIKYVP